MDTRRLLLLWLGRTAARAMLLGVVISLAVSHAARADHTVLDLEAKRPGGPTETLSKYAGKSFGVIGFPPNDFRAESAS